MGPNGSGQVDAGLLDRRPPEVHRHRRHGHPRRRRRAGDDRRRAGPGRAVPGHAVPGRGARRLGRQLPAHRQDRDRRRGAQAAHLGQGASTTAMEPRADGPGVRRSATSTRASPAARRSGTRSCSSSCSSRRSRSSTRPTPASTSTRCKVVSEGVNRVREDGETGVLLITHYTRILRYITARLRARLRRRPDRRGGRPGAGRQLEAEGYEQVHGRRSDAWRMTPGDRSRRSTSEVRKDFPILERSAQRRPAGLPGQRQHLAEAAVR